MKRTPFGHTRNPTAHAPACIGAWPLGLDIRVVIGRATDARTRPRSEG